MQRLFLILGLLAVTLSCNRDEVITVGAAPTITLDNPSGIYTAKVGRELTIAPRYTNADGAAFVWSADGRDICHEPSYTFIPERVGEIFLRLVVTTSDGRAEELMRVDVVEREIPAVMLAGVEPGDDFAGFFVIRGEALELVPTVRECSIPTTYLWTVDGREFSREKACTFRGDACGDYLLRFTAENEDGSSFIEFDVHVREAGNMPFTWHFGSTEYRMASGRRIRIAPEEIVGGESATWQWSVDGVEVEGAVTPEFIFDRTEVGRYNVTLASRVAQAEGSFTLSESVTVEVCPREGAYRREKSAASNAAAQEVVEYTPAPGQFINEPDMGFTGAETTAATAAEYAAGRLAKGSLVSLGGFGGYIVVKFDHSVANSGGYDIAISGNAMKDSSEPGIVWVMQDENGDGKANDTWYELRGSEDGKAGTLKEYAVTYYRPAAAGMAVPWRDNRGASGTIDHIPGEHSQPFYYPLWISADSYTLRGTRLEARNYDASGNGTYWIQPAYGWGYADNFSSTDRLVAEDGNADAPSPNRVRISDAINFEGRPVDLAYIDFVKVQTALNTKSGWTGENSTEVSRVADCSML